MTQATKHAALAYPPPADDVEVDVTRHTTSQRTDTDVLTGEVTGWTKTELEASATAWGRTERYRRDQFGPKSEAILWHVHGGGSSSSLQFPPAEEVLNVIRRHTAEREDPCDSYGTAWCLGNDLTAKVHLRPNWGTETLCGRTVPRTATRVLRSTVDDEQWCQSCERAL